MNPTHKYFLKINLKLDVDRLIMYLIIFNSIIKYSVIMYN